MLNIKTKSWRIIFIINKSIKEINIVDLSKIKGSKNFSKIIKFSIVIRIFFRFYILEIEIRKLKNTTTNSLIFINFTYKKWWENFCQYLDEYRLIYELITNEIIKSKTYQRIQIIARENRIIRKKAKTSHYSTIICRIWTTKNINTCQRKNGNIN